MEDIRSFSERRGYQDQDEEDRVEDRSAAEINNSVGITRLVFAWELRWVHTPRIVERPVARTRLPRVARGGGEEGTGEETGWPGLGARRLV